MLLKHSKAGSKVPLMTFVSSLNDVLRSGGDFTLVRRLWGYFLASLGCRKPEFTLQWSRSETVVSDFFLTIGTFRTLHSALVLFCLIVRYVSAWPFTDGFVISWCLFQSVLCQGRVPRRLRIIFKSIVRFREYSLQYEKDVDFERCFVLFWEENYLKKVCVGRESLTQTIPKPELLPLARIICSLESKRLLLVIVGGSPSLARVLADTRNDGRVFVAYQPFDSEMLIRCFQQAYQDVFSMVKLTTLVEYTIHRLKTAVYEDWMEERATLCKSVCQGFVDFAELRRVLSGLAGLWSSIRPFVRCTGIPETKDEAESVSHGLVCVYTFCGKLVRCVFVVMFCV